MTNMTAQEGWVRAGWVGGREMVIKSCRAVGYRRVSTEAQADSALGMDAQLTTIESLAARLNLPLVAVHDDNGLSGSLPVESRPGLIAAIDMLRPGDALCIARRDRLGRDVLHVAMIQRLVERKSARVVSPDPPDDDSPTSVLMRQILDAFSEFERMLIRQRTKSAMAAARAKNRRIGHLPYGKKLAPDGRHLELHPDEQQTLRTIHAMRRSGLTLKGIAERLNETGSRTRRNAALVFSGSIRAVGPAPRYHLMTTTMTRTPQYALSMEVHERLEALYPRVEQHGARFRGLVRVDSALPKPPGRYPRVRVDPVVCALAIKAATTKRAVVTLCEQGDGDNAFALMRVLLENACLLEWLIRGEGPRRLETYIAFTSVVHERLVAVAERFRERFMAAGAESLPASDPYHVAVTEHMFGNPPKSDDRPTRELTGYKGTLKRVSVKEMFDEIKTTEHSFEYQMLYGALGSDIIHSGPFSLTRTMTTLLDREMFVLRPMPLSDLCTLALGMSNAAMFLVLDSLNEFVGLGLSEELNALKAGNQKSASDGNDSP